MQKNLINFYFERSPWIKLISSLSQPENAKENEVSSLLVQLLEPLHLRLMSRLLNPTQAGKRGSWAQTQFKAKVYLSNTGGSAVRVQYSLGAGVHFPNFVSFEMGKEEGKQLDLNRHIRDRVDA